MITCKLNPRVYDSLLVLLAAVHLYRVYRWLDTLPLYLYYELLILIATQAPMHCLICLHLLSGVEHPWALCVHIRQCTCACVKTITCKTVQTSD